MSPYRAGSAIALFGLLLLSAAVQARQTLPVDSLFRAHRMPLVYGAAGLSGAGWSFLVDESAAAQFVMVGESHNLLEVPLFTARLFEALHTRSGFDYLALENGPYAMEQLSSPSVRGDLDAITALATRYVNALQFRTDQELEMMAAVGRASGARHAPFWGIDNEWGTQHILERLAVLAGGRPGPRLASLLEESGALERVRPDEQNPRYINDRLTTEAVSALRREVGEASAEATRLLDALQTAHEIYAARGDGPANYRANHRREQYMRQRFVAEYSGAVQAGDTLPRVVLKFGQWHALRGVLNWGDVEPFGTFVAEFARSHGMHSLHIWTGLVNEPGHVWTLHDFPDYVPLASAGTTDGWWVVDLRPIRALVAGGRVTGVNDELRKVIFGFDLALLIGGGNRATMERLGG